MSVQVSYSDLEMGYRFTCGGGEAVVDPATGEVHLLDEDALDSSNFDSSTGLVVPGRDDLGLDLVNDFINERHPEAFAQVRGMFSRRGGWRRFKDWLARTGRIDDWHDFENDEVRRALSEWCEDNDLELVD